MRPSCSVPVRDPICTPARILSFGSALQGAGIDWRATIYGGAEHAFWAAPAQPGGSPSGGTGHPVPTVPGVGFHATHAARAWLAILDFFHESLGTS